MKQRLVLSLLMVSVMGLMACQKSSDDKSSPALSSDFVGNWSFQVANGVVPSNSKYQDNLQTESGSGYMIFKVDPLYNITMESVGLESPDGKTIPEERIIKGMSLGKDTERSGLILLSQETIEAARKQGTSEAEIQKALKNPCKLVLNSATAAKYQCDGDPEGSELVKISDAVVAAQKLESKNYFTKKDQVRKTLSAKLGNTTWKLAEVKHLIKQADGKVYDYKDDVTAMSAESSSTQDGKTYTDVNAKTLAFSADLETAKINDKQTVQIEWTPMKKSTGAKLLLRLKTGDSSYQILSQSGALVLSDDGSTLTLSEDFLYDGTRNQKTTVFNRVK